jgi:hypothetical protein
MEVSNTKLSQKLTLYSFVQKKNLKNRIEEMEKIQNLELTKKL